jgi:hypothetical protein
MTSPEASSEESRLRSRATSRMMAMSRPHVPTMRKRGTNDAAKLKYPNAVESSLRVTMSTKAKAAALATAWPVTIQTALAAN